MIGTRLSDRYEITGELGRGGMGIVYRARDPLLDRDVAVKVIAPALMNEQAQERFQREAQLVAKMDHPGIVPIYDVGRHEESLYLVMPVIGGTSLRAFLRDKSLRLGDVLDVGIAVSGALAYSHGQGVVHRDIKPENIMVARESGGLRVRVMDFGLARMSTGTRITQTGMLVGTMAYLSPEQVLSKPVDARTDVYALGSVLYECLAGRPPFTGEMQSILFRVAHESPEPLRGLGAEIDEELEAVVLSCLAKEPAERPADAEALAEALRRCRAQLGDSERGRSVVLASGPAPVRPALAPFVGRRAEVEELQRRLNAAVAGECQFVVVGGEPGSGKTRLLDELEALARARGLRVLHGRFVEQNRALPYQGFCEAIQEYFRHRETASSSTELPDFSDIAADLVALFPMLAEIGEIRRAATEEGSLSVAAESQKPENRSQVFELLARAFARIAAGKPLVLVLEELHGAEVSLEALQYIVPRLGPTPTLVLGTYRTTEVDKRHPLSRFLDAFEGDRRFVARVLGPFNASEHRRFLETLVGGPSLADDLVERIYERTEGNPFFTKELVRSLLDAGAIGQDDTGTWSLVGQAGIQSEELPATIQQAVEKRIQRLPQELRDVLSVAAVLGKTFDFQDLESLVEGDADRAVDRLVQEGLVEEERDARSDLLTFSSTVVRDVLYAEIPRRRRRSLHRRCARQIEERQKGRLERVHPQLLYHYSEGDVPDKTVEYGLRLAADSLGAFSPEEAVYAARAALEFLDEEWDGDPGAEGEARLLLARAHRMAGALDQALFEAERAAEVHSRLDRREPTLESLLLAGEVAWQARRPDDALRFVERGLELARDGPGGDTRRRLLFLGATLANFRGEYDRAAELVKEADRGARGERPGGSAVARGGTLVVPLPSPVEAREPAEMHFDVEVEVLTNTFETLLTTDREGNLVPQLCEEWSMAEDGRTLHMTLREGVRFHDGTVLDAPAVKRSLEHCARRASHRIPAALGAIDGMDAVCRGEADTAPGLVATSERELEIRLRETLPIFPALLTDVNVAIARASDGRAVGTGPFAVAAHEDGRVVLERNDGYWKGSTATLDAIEFHPSRGGADIAAGLEEGRFDLGRDLHPDTLERILKEPRFRGAVVEVPQRSTCFVLFNVVSGPAARDPAVRRALAGVVRTADLVWKTLGRLAHPAVALIPPGIPGHDAGRRRANVRLEEAKEAVAAAGAPLRLRASVHPPLLDRCRAMVDALFALWGELGVEVTVGTTDMASWTRTWEDNEGFDLLLARYSADYNDPDNFTHSLFHSGGGMCRKWFVSPETDRILEEGRAEARPAAREGIYRRLETLLQDQAVVIPLFHDVAYRVAGPRVRGLKLRSRPPYVNYAEVAKAGEDAPLPAPARPKAGGVLHVPVTTPLPSLDPATANMVEQFEIIHQAFETHTRDVGGARIAPWLAASFSFERGGRTYHFRLRDDVTFHDGRRFTARDVRYTFERALLAHGEGARVLSAIRGAAEFAAGKTLELAGFRIESTHAFTIELAEPVSFFPALLSDQVTAIVPEGSDRVATGEKDGWVGTGPYRVVRFRKGAKLELEANPHYWRPGVPRNDGVVFHFGVSGKDVLAGFREGRLSLASDLLPEDVESLRRDARFAAGYAETPGLSVCVVLFNARRGPLADRAQRERIAASIPVASLVRQTLGRLAIPASGLVPPGLVGHDPVAPSRAPGPPRPGEPLELKALIHPVFLGKYAALTRKLEAALEQHGIRMTYVNKTMAEFMETPRSSVDVLFARWSADYPDTHNFVHPFLHSSEGIFGGICGEPALDELIQAGKTETDRAARHALYRRIEERIAKETLLLPLFHEQVYRFARPEVDGLQVSYWPPFVRYEDLSFR